VGAEEVMVRQIVDLARLRGLRESGKTTKQISEETGWSKSAIEKWLLRLGLTVNNQRSKSDRFEASRVEKWKLALPTNESQIQFGDS
jgi:hypothetical protein